MGNEVLRKITGPESDEVTEDWRKIHNEGFMINSSCNIVKVIKLRNVRWLWHIACMGRMRETGCEGMDWIQVAEDRIHLWSLEHRPL
jgi:hypothetical protein